MADDRDDQEPLPEADSAETEEMDEPGDVGDGTDEPSADDGESWIESLEATGHQAVTRLEELTAENARLQKAQARLQKENQRLAGESEKPQAKLDSGPEDVATPTTGSDEADWHEERAALRRRVEALTENLEALLDA